MDDRKQIADLVELNAGVFDYFTRCMIPIRQEITYVMNSDTQPMRAALTEQLQAIDEASLVIVRDSYGYQKRAPSEAESDLELRIWALSEALSWEIPRRRLAALTSIGDELPAPLDINALRAIRKTSEHLVWLDDFQMDGSRLLLDDHAFMPLSPVESPNSQFWYLQELRKLEDTSGVKVRLDPLLYGSREELPLVAYKMLVYGRPLDWHRIGNLREEEHGQWMPKWKRFGVEVTDYAWTPRGAEIHFRCEELPAQDHCEVRGSRYFHAIYVPADKVFIHLDAAVRVFSEEKWAERKSIGHVRKAAKSGTRHKVFRIDTPVSVETFSNLCTQYFVWNDDVARYFGGNVI